ncbi:hypothetical protein F5878DRAFT_402781 [Lentinula raphanica]|uniref:Uncharacterized protein n=1 Tax=Lentinula raphanica TaxID=153919 RepID=A0AA38U715_9AGAR|nr:hypothetical protein F5878DRAFT_402781 [Lentinula raphanica]
MPELTFDDLAFSRTTRSKRIFNPYLITPAPGQPIQGPLEFDIQDALNEQNNNRMEQEDRGEGYDSEEEAELEDEDEDDYEELATSVNAPCSSMPHPFASHHAPSPLSATSSTPFSRGHWVSEIDVVKALGSSSGWIGRRRTFPRKHTSLEELYTLGFKLLDSQLGETYPIVDRNRKIIGVFGAPSPEQSATVVRDANAALEQAHEQIYFTAKQKKNRRGDYPAAAYGISFGGGQRRPGILKHSAKTAAILQSLLKDLAFISISDYNNSLLTTFAPRVHQYYSDGLTQLQEWNPRLVRNFPGTSFAACTWNFGPAAVSYPHTDNANVAFGWCSITALGDYNPDLGGHLVLWDLGLIIRFPPGATILIPSALLVHSNVPIQEGEKRYAFVQYTAGGLFRWIDHGFQSYAQWEKNASAPEKQQYKLDRKARVRNGYNRFSTFSEIVGGS